MKPSLSNEAHDFPYENKAKLPTHPKEREAGSTHRWCAEFEGDGRCVLPRVRPGLEAAGT